MRPPDRQQAAEHSAHPDEQPTGRCRLRARPRQPAAHARAQRLPQRCASAPSAMLSSNVGRQPVAIAPALLAQPPPLERELGRAPGYAAVCKAWRARTQCHWPAGVPNHMHAGERRP